MKKKKTFPLHRRIEAFSTISRAITSDLYLEDILRLIVTVTAGVMNSKICSLWTLDEKGQELKLQATQAIDAEYIKERTLKVGEGVVGIVARQRKPLVILNVLKEPKYKEKHLARKLGLRSLLSVPMEVKGRITGVINSYTSASHRFTKSEINVLTTVANQAAIVIENAELMVRSKVIAAELETRKVVERAKGMLMKNQGLSEEAAYRKLQKKSMNTRRSIREVAEAVLLAEDIKK